MKFTYKKLDKLCDIIIGRTPSRSKKEYWGEGFTWVSISDLKSKVITKTKEEITKLGIDKSRSRLIKKGTLLLSFKLSIGKLAFAGKDLYTNEAIVALPIVNEREIDRNYLYYSLKYIPLIGGNQAAMGKTLNKASLSELMIPLPSLTDQKRIAKVLSDCEQLIAWRKESIQLLDDYLEATFLEMFGLDNPEYKNWPIEKIESYARNKKGSMRTGPFGSNLKHDEFTDAGDVKVLGIDNVVKNIFESGKPRYITNKKFQELKRYQVYPKDVLISIMATNGRSAVVPENIPLAINTKHLAAITLDETKILSFYLKYSFEYHPLILKQLSKNMKGAIMSGLNLTIIKNLKLPRPSITLQEKFSEIVIKQRKVKDMLLNNLIEIQNLYSSLSQKAFKGQLDLSNLIIDEVVEPISPSKESVTINVEKDKHVRLKKANKKSQKKRNIRNLDLLDYLGVPEELYVDKMAVDYDPRLDFIKDDLFYQFYLKDNYAEESFTFSDLHKKFNEDYIIKGQDFEPRKWKSILYKFMEGKKPLVEQIFEEATGTIKLKLTDEAFKA